MVLQHVMALVNAGYTKAEIEAMTNEETPNEETPKEETPKEETPKEEAKPMTDKAQLEATASEGFTIDYDKLSQSMLKAFQSANIRQSQQPTAEKTDLSKFF